MHHPQDCSDNVHHDFCGVGARIVGFKEKVDVCTIYVRVSFLESRDHGSYSSRGVARVLEGGLACCPHLSTKKLCLKASWRSCKIATSAPLCSAVCTRNALVHNTPFTAPPFINLFQALLICHTDTYPPALRPQPPPLALQKFTRLRLPRSEIGGGAYFGGAYFAFLLGFDNSHTTPQKKRPDEEELLWDGAWLALPYRRWFGEHGFKHRAQ